MGGAAVGTDATDAPMGRALRSEPQGGGSLTRSDAGSRAMPNGDDDTSSIWNASLTVCMVRSTTHVEFGSSLSRLACKGFIAMRSSRAHHSSAHSTTSPSPVFSGSALASASALEGQRVLIVRHDGSNGLVARGAQRCEALGSNAERVRGHVGVILVDELLVDGRLLDEGARRDDLALVLVRMIEDEVEPLPRPRLHELAIEHAPFYEQALADDEGIEE
jgi:hypothetical protein